MASRDRAALNVTDRSPLPVMVLSRAGIGHASVASRRNLMIH